MQKRITKACKAKAFKICNSAKSKYGWGAKRKEACVLKLKKKLKNSKC